MGLQTQNIAELTINVIRKALKRDFGKAVIKENKTYIKSFVKDELFRIQEANVTNDQVEPEPEPDYANEYPENNFDNLPEELPEEYGDYGPPVEIKKKAPKKRKAPKKKKKKKIPVVRNRT